MEIIVKIIEEVKKRCKRSHKKHKLPSSRIHNLRVHKHMSTATLTWTNPTTRIDGSALAASDIASVNIFDQITNPNFPAPTIQIGSVGPGVNTFTTSALASGTHNFTVVVVDTQGNSSASSNVAVLSVGSAVPSAVTNLVATLNP